ncbi:MAG TPA: permease, partial [Gemmataceae bacterium]|nr:permease [Gemmataceae bacterium]
MPFASTRVLNTVDYESLILIFTAIIYEALPFIVLGVVLAGILEEFVPQQAIAKVIPRNRLLAIGLGGLLGIVFPMCECGIIVVMKRLLRKGLPLSVCVSYVLSGPIINVVVISSTYVAFTNNSIYGSALNVVWLRCGLGYLVSVITSLVVEWQFQRHGTKLLHPSLTRGLRDPDAEDDNGDGAPRPWWQRLNNISETALHDFVDIMAFLILGAGLAAIGRAALRESHFETMLQQTPAISILIMMSLAILFCLCSEADAFVAANFAMTWPPASKIAFLVLGPMLDMKLYLMY